MEFLKMKYSNNFDFIRLFAATLVIVGHAYAILGRTLETPVFLGSSVSTYAVKIFFVISGYLIVQSWVYNPKPVNFIIKRALRIFPALIVVVMLSALIMGPLVTSLTIEDYFAHPLLKLYFFNTILFIVYQLPGVFENNIFPNAVNGSLWSLPVEVFQYILVLIIGVISLSTSKNFKLLWILLTIFIFTIKLKFIFFPNVEITGIIIYGTLVSSVLEVSPYFMMGGVFYVLKDKIPLRIIFAITILFIAQYLASYNISDEFISIFVTTYAVLAFAKVSTPFIRDIGKYGDVSYGVYLYGFPVAQFLSYQYAEDYSLIVHMIATILISYAFAFASWHLVEKRVLRLKPKGSVSTVPISE